MSQQYTVCCYENQGDKVFMMIRQFNEDGTSKVLWYGMIDQVITEDDKTVINHIAAKGVQP